MAYIIFRANPDKGQEVTCTTFEGTLEQVQQEIKRVCNDERVPVTYAPADDFNAVGKQLHDWCCWGWWFV